MSRNSVLLKSLGYHKIDLILMTISMLVVFTLILLCGSLNTALPQLIDNRTNHNVHARMIYATHMENTFAENQAQIQQIAGVFNVFPKQARLMGDEITLPLANQEVVFHSMISGADQHMMPPVSEGEPLDFTQKQLLIPERIETKAGEWIDGRSFIGNDVTLNVDELEFTDATYSELRIKTVHEVVFQIVGTYDPTLGHYLENEIMAPLDQVESMNRISERQIAKVKPRDQTVMVLVENYEDMGSVKTALEDNGFMASEAYSFNFQLCYMELYVARVLGVAMIVMGVLVISVLQARSMNKKTTDICLLKVMGYSDKMVAGILYWKTAFVCLGAWGGALIINLMIYPIANKEMFGYAKITIMTWDFVLLNLLLVMIIPFMVMGISLWRMNKMSLITLMKEED